MRNTWEYLYLCWLPIFDYLKENGMVVEMRKGDLLADLVSHYGISQTIVKLHGWDVHGRIMEALMSSQWEPDAEVHFYLRPDSSAPDGLRIELELAGEVDGPWKLS